MDQQVLNVLMSQVGTQGPALFVLVVAMVLAFVYMGRATMASLLTLAAVAVMLATKIGVSVVQSNLIAAKDGMEVVEFGRQMGTIGFYGALGNAAGLALLVAAIFIRRRRIQVAV